MSDSISLVKNASDEKQVKRAVEKEGLRKRQLEDSVRFVMSDRRGRRFVWNLLSICGENSISYVPGTNDADKNAIFYEGQRNIGLKLKADITSVDQEAYFSMMREADDDAKKLKGEKDGGQ